MSTTPEPTHGAAASTKAVRAYFAELQDRICDAMAEIDGTPFDSREIHNNRGGIGRPRVLKDGPVFEQAAVNVTFARGDHLPPAASKRKPELAGRAFEAASISVIAHPRNPHAPTSHANLRFFRAAPSGSSAEPAWWFGGGFDLTPYYGYAEDAYHWHSSAQDAVQAFGSDLYPRFKEQCDEYFYLPHRQEPRGIGGLFFDDLSELAEDGANSDVPEETQFDRCWALTRSVGDHLLPAYMPIVERRHKTSYTERERRFQLLRRGRYVEFNLIHDRGTRYGLQAGARTESVLASLPPNVSWEYDFTPEPGSAEAALLSEFLTARDWLAEPLPTAMTE